MKYRFCPICGSYLKAKDPMSAPSCPSGHYTFQSQLGVEVAPVIRHRHYVLLTGSATQGWQLPVQTVQANVTPVQATSELVHSMVQEECTVGALVNLRSNKVLCTLFYEVQVNNQPESSHENTQWFALDEIPYQQMVHPLHRDVLKAWASQQMPFIRPLVSVS